MPSALDDRTFENAVEQSPEEQAATLAHFKDKGYDVQVEESGEEQHQPADKPAEPKTPAPPEPDKSAAAPPAPEKAVPAAGAPAAEEHEAIDAETRAEYQAESTKSDEEKLGRHAKRTKRLHELETARSEDARKLAVQEATIAELRARVAQPSTPSSLVATPQPAATPAKEPAKAEEPIKPVEFSEARPARPKLEDYADQDDPVAALEEARTEYTEKLVDWNDKRRAFDQTEKQRVDTAQRERDTQRQTEVKRNEGITKRLSDVRQAHPNFDRETDAANFGRDNTNKIMRHLLVESLPDGLELAYELAQPAHQAELEEIVKKVGDPKTPDEVSQALYVAAQEIAIFRYKLKSETKPPAAPVAAVPPLAAAAAAAAPQQTSPNQPPRREEPSPTPIKGRSAAPTLKPEDVDPMDSDARRKLRKERGEM